MSNENIDKFFQLCELKDLIQSYAENVYVLKTNFHYWNIYISDFKIKGGQWIINISMPYKEMGIELKENSNDKQLFGCHVARVSLKQNEDVENSWSFFSKLITIKISIDTKYLIFDTYYFYPHNVYYLNNYNYLYNKILYSITMFKNFIETYNGMFSNGIPILYIKSATETRTDYEINIILTNCITITYIQTDLNENTIYCHLFVDNAKKKLSMPPSNPSNPSVSVSTSTSTSNPSTSTSNPISTPVSTPSVYNPYNSYNMFHVVNLRIPRVIKNNNIYFKFTTSQK